MIPSLNLFKTYICPKILVTQYDKEGKLSESFGGKKPIEIINELTYLGVEICSDGKNMKNIIN